MSSDGLKELINIGNDFTAGKYYSIATTTIFFYDYFLTLADEIKYAWHGRKSWVFAIFLANRYLPMGYQLWYLYTSYGTTFHQQLYECEKTVFFEILVAVETTLLAQVVITLRIYAITSKNRMITSFFCVITASQFILGLYLTAYAATRGAVQLPPVPLPVYMACLFVGRASLNIGFTAMSLVYDLLAFSLIVYRVVRSNVNEVPISSLLRTIVRDATYYFLVVFTSHLALFVLFASFRSALLPAAGNVVYIQVMITRLLLSLKKAVTLQKHGWSFGEPTTHTTMRFAERRDGIITRDVIRLDTFASTQEGTPRKSGVTV